MFIEAISPESHRTLLTKEKFDFVQVVVAAVAQAKSIR
jgi:hypothetical protein